MLHFYPRPLLVCLLGAMGAAHVSCAPVISESTSLTTGAGTAGSSTTSGAGGAGGDSSSGGSFSVDPGVTSAGSGTCAFPSPDDPADYTGVPVQSWCAPAAANPPACPLDKPLAGAACSISGLQCAYEKTPDEFVLATCGQGWAEAAHLCHIPCTPSGSSVDTPAQPACGALADIQCAGGVGATDQERTNRTLEDIGACCAAENETTLVVLLVDGCASAASGPPALVNCVNALLAGRRLDCAKELSCAKAEWSTLP